MNFHKQVVWTTQDGKQFFALKDIEDMHLVNIVRMLRRSYAAVKNAVDDFYEDWGPIWDVNSAPPDWIVLGYDHKLKRVRSRLGAMSKEARRRGLETDDPPDAFKAEMARIAAGHDSNGKLGA